MTFRSTAALAATLFFISASPQPLTAVGVAPWPPQNILGRWVGEGKLGFREGKFETVKCRVTYFTAEGAHLGQTSLGQTSLKQYVRCATSGANIDVRSVITEAGGALSGTWHETVYNLKGDISGETTAKGFRVKVKSDDLSANMDLILNNDMQVIEIQFHNSALMGLSIILTKG
jgi:hypothetical protein